MLKNVVGPILVVLVFWGLSTVATTYYIRGLESLPNRMILEDLTTIHAAGAMRHDLRQIERAMIESNRPVSPTVREQVSRLEGEFMKHHAEAVATANSAEELDVDGEIRNEFDLLRDEIDRQVQAPSEPEAAVVQDMRNLLHLSNQVAASELRLIDMNERFMKETATTRSLSSRVLYVARFGLLILGPLAGIACGFWISRRFHRSMTQISITLGDVATEMHEQVGRVSIRESSELPAVLQQVNVVVARIREVMQQLGEARRQAISAERLAALGEMAAGVAHELRNPLTSVKLLIQSGAQRPERSLTDKQFRVVLEEISRMESTIERMLDFARPPRMNRMTHDLRDIVSHALSLIQGRAQHCRVQVAGELPAAAVPVNADGTQLGQVFGNLFQNAIEAMPRGGTLQVSMEPCPAAKVCRVQCSDSGTGISAAVLGRIFEPFVTDKARGTGLGLAVSHRIVRDHGGTLMAANREQGGSVFTVELPLAAALPVAADPTSRPPPAGIDLDSFSHPEPIHAQAAHH